MSIIEIRKIDYLQKFMQILLRDFYKKSSVVNAWIGSYIITSL